MKAHFHWTVIAALAFFFAGSAAQALEIKVLSAGAMEEPLKHIAADFTKTTGHTVTFAIDTVGALQRRLRAGEKADVAVLSIAGIEALQKDKVLPADGHTDLARVLMGVGVREGAPLPDISTTEAFRQMLLAASAVAATDPASGGTTGIYFANLLQRLGIAEEIKKKSVLRPGGKFVAEALSRGEAEVGITFISELLPMKGVKVVGPFPEAIQSKTTYAASIHPASEVADTARAFITFANSADASHHFKDAGLEAVVTGK